MLSGSRSRPLAAALSCVACLAWTQAVLAQTRPPLVPITYSSYRIIGAISDSHSSMMFVEARDPAMVVVVRADSDAQGEDAVATKRLEKCRMDTAGGLDRLFEAAPAQLEASRVAQAQGKPLSAGDTAALQVMPGVIDWYKGTSGQPRYGCVLGSFAAKVQ